MNLSENQSLKAGGFWKVKHQHTSAPVDSDLRDDQHWQPMRSGKWDYDNVAHLDGGLKAWKEAGLPVSI